MIKNKPTVLIGSLTKENIGPIPTITRAFMEGLADRYVFIPHITNRKFGLGSMGTFNLLNIYYLLKHMCLWIIELVRYRPKIAHYPLTSYWNIEKSLMFLMVAKLFSVKIIAHLHGGSFDVFWMNLSPTRKKIDLLGLYRLDALVVLSDGWKKWICKNIGLKDEKVMVVNNPIDSQFENRALSFKAAENTNLFFIGSIGKRKGVYDILAVASLLNKKGINTRISLAGPEAHHGDLKNIKKIISQKQLNRVKIIEPLYGSKKIEYFEQNSIFLFPSYNENFPLVVLEAAAAGKAIITTRVGAIPEFFEHNRSVLFVEPGNVEQIANAVIELINDQEKRHRLGIAAREIIVNKLSRDKIFQSLHDVYQSVLVTYNIKKEG